jgi:hypothetical protein
MATSVKGDVVRFRIDLPPKGVAARIVFASYRQSAEMYMKAWRDCVVKSFAKNSSVEIVQLHIIDLSVCCCSHAPDHRVWHALPTICERCKVY